MIALPSFAFLARALVLVVDRSWAVTASSLCLQAVAVAPRVLGPGRPSTLDHTSRVVRRCGKIRRGAVLLNFLVSGTICATVGCWRVVAVPALCLLARRLPCFFQYVSVFFSICNIFQYIRYFDAGGSLQCLLFVFLHVDFFFSTVVNIWS